MARKKAATSSRRPKLRQADREDNRRLPLLDFDWHQVKLEVGGHESFPFVVKHSPSDPGRRQHVTIWRFSDIAAAAQPEDTREFPLEISEVPTSLYHMYLNQEQCDLKEFRHALWQALVLNKSGDDFWRSMGLEGSEQLEQALSLQHEAFRHGYADHAWAVLRYIARRIERSDFAFSNVPERYEPDADECKEYYLPRVEKTEIESFSTSVTLSYYVDLITQDNTLLHADVKAVADGKVAPWLAYLAADATIDTWKDIIDEKVLVGRNAAWAQRFPFMSHEHGWTEQDIQDFNHFHGGVDPDDEEELNAQRVWIDGFEVKMKLWFEDFLKSLKKDALAGNPKMLIDFMIVVLQDNSFFQPSQDLRKVPFKRDPPIGSQKPPEPTVPTPSSNALLESLLFMIDVPVPYLGDDHIPEQEQPSNIDNQKSARAGIDLTRVRAAQLLPRHILMQSRGLDRNSIAAVPFGGSDLSVTAKGREIGRREHELLNDPKETIYPKRLRRQRNAAGNDMRRYVNPRGELWATWGCKGLREATNLLHGLTKVYGEERIRKSMCWFCDPCEVTDEMTALLAYVETLNLGMKEPEGLAWINKIEAEAAAYSTAASRGTAMAGATDGPANSGGRNGTSSVKDFKTMTRSDGG